MLMEVRLLRRPKGVAVTRNGPPTSTHDCARPPGVQPQQEWDAIPGDTERSTEHDELMETLRRIEADVAHSKSRASSG